MKKSILKLVSVVVVMIAFSYTAFAQSSFEGVIEFKKISTSDTTNYIYYVKDNKVRIDEIGSNSHKVEGSFLVDMDAKTIKALNHDRKLYTDQPTLPAPIIKGMCHVVKGQETKTLQGFKCTEYTVSNNEEATVITYWLADGKFGFFEKLLHQLNRKDKASVYFLQIGADTKNMFPMLSEQKDLNGTVIGKLEVTKISAKKVDSGMFEVPKGYNKFEK